MAEGSYRCPVAWCSSCSAKPPAAGTDRLVGDHRLTVLDVEHFGMIGVGQEISRTDAGYVLGQATVFQVLPPHVALVPIDAEILGLAFKLASRIAEAIEASEWGDVDDAERYLSELESEGR